MTDENDQATAEQILEGSPLEVADLISVYQKRDEQSQKDLAVRDALIMRMHRESMEQAQQILALRMQVEAISKIDELTAGPQKASRAARRAPAKKAAAKRAPVKKTTRKR